jgi:Na+-transporting NADH:ubiquinone oxidoreductase subunit NqrF
MQCEQGYISQDIIKKYVTNPNDSLYYICGPERMKDTAKKVLKDVGIKNKNVFVEDFFW